MNNILCKTGLHKWRKVKSTKTNVLDIMKSILRARNELIGGNEEIICKKFRVDNLWIFYDRYDKVCIRPGCNCFKHGIAKKRNQLIEDRNFILQKEENNRYKNKKIENIYKECKNRSLNTKQRKKQ